MKVVELLERRRRNWQELERSCDQLQASPRVPKLPPPAMSRFAALYRAACADLALAHAYQLPQNTVLYLHRLVGRAHNQLYRSRRFEFQKWSQMLLHDVPKQVFNDRCVQLMFVLFWGLFILSAWLSYSKTAWPDFAEQMMGEQTINQLEEMYKNPIGDSGRGGDENAQMWGYYIQNNAGIGLRCFAWGLLVIPGLLTTMFNAVFLGSAFGYMARPEVYGTAPNYGPGGHFFHFVTAHGPFELTAICLSAGAGLRLGLAWMMPGPFTRLASLQKAGKAMMPVILAAVLMFVIAAVIEGFLSPSPLPYEVKAGVAVISSALLTFYFVVLGFPRRLAV
ncbi:MAG: stage II sporulation protein M [Pirellulaceae bacterium]|nr:stage II sporulation protein M [Pirellulaceae bacterium]